METAMQIAIIGTGHLGAALVAAWGAAYGDGDCRPSARAGKTRLPTHGYHSCRTTAIRGPRRLTTAMVHRPIGTCAREPRLLRNAQIDTVNACVRASGRNALSRKAARHEPPMTVHRKGQN